MLVMLRHWAQVTSLLLGFLVMYYATLLVGDFARLAIPWTYQRSLQSGRRDQSAFKFLLRE